MLITSFLTTIDRCDLSRCFGQAEMYPLDGLHMSFDICIAVPMVNHILLESIGQFG